MAAEAIKAESLEKSAFVPINVGVAQWIVQPPPKVQPWLYPKC